VTTPPKSKETMDRFYHHFQPECVRLIQQMSDEEIVSVKLSEITEGEGMDVKRNPFSPESDDYFRSIIESGKEKDLPPVFLELSDGTKRDFEGNLILAGYTIVDGRHRVRAKRLLDPEGCIRAVIFYPLAPVERIILGVWPNWGGPQKMTDEDIEMNVVAMMKRKYDGGLALTAAEVRKAFPFIPSITLNKIIHTVDDRVSVKGVIDARRAILKEEMRRDLAIKHFGLSPADIKALDDQDFQKTRNAKRDKDRMGRLDGQFKSINTTLTNAVEAMIEDVQNHRLSVASACKRLDKLAVKAASLAKRFESSKAKIKRAESLSLAV